jgi:hypothetical protein
MKEKEITEEISIRVTLIRDSNGILNVPRTLESLQRRFDYLKISLNSFILSDSTIQDLISNLFFETFKDKKSSDNNYLNMQYIIVSLLNKIGFSQDNIHTLSNHIECFIKKNSDYKGKNNKFLSIQIIDDSYAFTINPSYDGGE